MTERELYEQVFKGQRDAVELMLLLGEISQIWDDLIDGDKKVDADQINQMMWSALVELPNNPFYARHFGQLNPLVQQIIFDWLTANKLEKLPDDRPRQLAFVLRDSLAGLTVQCAKIIGGFAWASEVAPLVRLYIHDEDYAAYVRGLG